MKFSDSDSEKTGKRRLWSQPSQKQTGSIKTVRRGLYGDPAFDIATANALPSECATTSNCCSPIPSCSLRIFPSANAVCATTGAPSKLLHRDVMFSRSTNMHPPERHPRVDAPRHKLKQDVFPTPTPCSKTTGGGSGRHNHAGRRAAGRSKPPGAMMAALGQVASSQAKEVAARSADRGHVGEFELATA